MVGYTNTEICINNLYHFLNIQDPTQINISDITKKLKVNLYYGNANFRFGNNIIITKSTSQKEWQSFGHEVGHYFKHVGSQASMHHLFIDLQEYQADYFSYHFCVPTFMLQQLKGVDVYVIMRLFNVEFDFAMRRLEMYQSKYLERNVVYEGSYS